MSFTCHLLSFCQNVCLLLFLGYVAEGGVTRQPYGGHRVAEALKGALTERKYHFFTEAEYPLVRLIMEKVLIP